MTSIEEGVPTSENELLNKAADYIEKYGWLQGEHGVSGGPVCVLGAFTFCDQTQCITGRTIQKLRNYLGDSHISISMWNDDNLRTKEEVIATLRAAASV